MTIININNIFVFLQIMPKDSIINQHKFDKKILDIKPEIVSPDTTKSHSIVSILIKIYYKMSRNFYSYILYFIVICI